MKKEPQAHETQFPNQWINEKAEDLIRDGARMEDFFCASCPRRQDQSGATFGDDAVAAEVWEEVRRLEAKLLDSVRQLEVSPITVALDGQCAWFGCVPPGSEYIEVLKKISLNKDQLRTAFNKAERSWREKNAAAVKERQPFVIRNLLLEAAAEFKRRKG